MLFSPFEAPQRGHATSTEWPFMEMVRACVTRLCGIKYLKASWGFAISLGLDLSLDARSGLSNFSQR